METNGEVCTQLRESQVAYLPVIELNVSCLAAYRWQGKRGALFAIACVLRVGQSAPVRNCTAVLQNTITFKVRVIANKKVDLKSWNVNYRNCCVPSSNLMGQLRSSERDLRRIVSLLQINRC